MYELRMAENNQTVQVIKEVLGGYNDFPPGWEEISIEDYIELSSSSFLPTHLDFRQMGNDMVSATLHINRDLTGFGIVPNTDLTLSFFKFDGLSRLKDVFNELPKIYDTGWTLDQNSSILYRGLKDFGRTIEFKRELNRKEEILVEFYLLRDKCPGWTGIMSKKYGKSYIYKTTYDSSD